MDPNIYTIETIGERYFESLNTGNPELHLLKESNVTPPEIKLDVNSWFSGFRSCLQMLPQIVPPPASTQLGNLGSRLPPVEGVVNYVTKHFEQKAKIAA